VGQSDVAAADGVLGADEVGRLLADVLPDGPGAAVLTGAVLPAVELACGGSPDPEVHPTSAASSATVASAVLPIDQG
jgi:hypothetical protein